MLGYPGAGKTTAAKVIHDVTGAIHLWADQERRDRFGEPSYSAEENEELYQYLNTLATDLLEGGQSVVFDTGFNYAKDREALRDIADTVNADCVLLWVTVDPELAKQRATQDAHEQDSRVLGDMHHTDFVRLAENLEPPQPNEDYIELDGTKITPEYVKDRLRL